MLIAIASLAVRVLTEGQQSQILNAIVLWIEVKMINRVSFRDVLTVVVLPDDAVNAIMNSLDLDSQVSLVISCQVTARSPRVSPRPPREYPRLRVVIKECAEDVSVWEREAFNHDEKIAD